MYNIILKWQTYEVSLFNNDEFTVENIENLTWGNSELALTTNPYMPGDNIANAIPMARDIGITIKPTADKGNYDNLVHKLGRLFNKEVTLVWKDRVIPANMEFQSEEMAALETDLQISGVVNEFDAPRFSDSVRIQLSIHCSNPFWEAEEQQAIASTGATYIACPYTEVDCGLTVGFDEGDYGVQSQTFSMDFHWEDESITPYYIELKRRTTEGVVSVDNIYVKIEKGKIKIYTLNDGVETDVSNFFTFTFYKGVKIEGGWQAEQVNELPVMPTSTVPFTLYAFFGTNRTDGTVKWKPLFL